MPKRDNTLRFLGLGALTAATASASIASFGGLDEPVEMPPVDALSSPPPGEGEWPFVSIIVPARNEERNLPRLLPSLLRQYYPNYEVIVVDDQSEDATPRILAEWSQRDNRLEVVHGVELPRNEGWLGKPHAMQQGAQAAKGEWLLFTDADTVHQPLSLSSSMAFALAHDIDLLSILPCAELGSLAEKLLMPVAFEGIFTLYPPAKVNDPISKVAIANGQYMLIRREVYDAVGGTARVKDKIAEDLELSKAVKGDGHRLFLADGRDLMSVRMYTNFAEVWQGWSKNVVLSFRENPAQGVFSFAGVFSLAALPYLMIAWSVRAWRRANKSHQTDDRVAAAWTTGLTAWGITLPLVYRRRVDKILGLPLGWTFTQPVGTAIFAVLLLYSFLRLLAGKGVTWKGRTYANYEL